MAKPTKTQLKAALEKIRDHALSVYYVDLGTRRGYVVLLPDAQFIQEIARTALKGKVQATEAELLAEKGKPE